MKKIFLLGSLLLGFQFGMNLLAQTKEAELTDLVNQIVKARNTSNILLPNYTWMSRVEVVKSKEILNIVIEKNQLDEQGRLVQKVLNEQGSKMPKTFLIKEIAESEKENMEKFLFGLRDYLKKYNLVETEQVRRFISGATWQVIDSTHEFEFKGRNLEEKGDELTWWVDDKLFNTARIEVSTVFEGDVVHFSGMFLRLKDGLNYLAYAEAHIPARNIVLQIQNYDYMHE
jgi:hypothetical protein